MWSPPGPLSAIGNKVKKIALVYSYAKNRATAWYANETGSMRKSIMNQASPDSSPRLSLKETKKKAKKVIALWQLIAEIQCYWLAVSAL